MKKLLITVFTLLSAQLTTVGYAEQSVDVLALMELERDYMVLVSEAKRQATKKAGADAEPECD